MASKYIRFIFIIFLCINFVSADVITSEDFIRKLSYDGKISIADLGQIIEEGKAVCSELSMFASVLLSQYGIRSRVNIGSLYMRELSPRPNSQHARHAWLEILSRNGKVEGILDSNNSRRFDRNFKDYDEFMNGIQVEHQVELMEVKQDSFLNSIMNRLK